jgi:hypothetical protein
MLVQLYCVFSKTLFMFSLVATYSAITALPAQKGTQDNLN